MSGNAVASAFNTYAFTVANSSHSDQLAPRACRCCICGAEQGVGDATFAPLAGDGRRTDAHTRPELSSGTVEYIAPADYTVRPPMPPCYFFVIDVSQNAVASGALGAICAAIRGTVDSMIERNSATKVGFLTYDSSVHFYNLSSSKGAAQMMVVPDIDDPFPPLPDEHYVTLEAARGAVDKLLESLPAAFAGANELDSAMGAALQVRAVVPSFMQYDRHCSLNSSHIVATRQEHWLLWDALSANTSPPLLQQGCADTAL